MDYFRDWEKNTTAIKSNLEQHYPWVDNVTRWDECLREAGVWEGDLSLIHFNQIMDNFNHGFSKE